jgi:hypothetical protein
MAGFEVTTEVPSRKFCALNNSLTRGVPRFRFFPVQGANILVYQNTTQPIALSSGDVGFSFNNETFPGSATFGTQFALPSCIRLADGATSVRWQTVFWNGTDGGEHHSAGRD